MWWLPSQQKLCCLLIILSLCSLFSSLLNLSDILKPNSKPSNLIRFSICVPVMHYRTSFHCRESFFCCSTQCEHSVLLQTRCSVVCGSNPNDGNIFFKYGQIFHYCKFYQILKENTMCDKTVCYVYIGFSRD